MFLAKSLAQKANGLGIQEICFMDNDEKKLDIYGRLAKRVANAIAPDVNFWLTSDPVASLEGADYVITTIRVGGDHMRVRDERIALSHGVLGQETTGAAGVSFAMRSIPALAEYCEIIKRCASPRVKVFNFTNPAGVVSQALRDMGYGFTYGICDAPSSMLAQVAHLYGVGLGDIEGECYGLNHLSFFSSVRIAGREILEELIEDDRVYSETELAFFNKGLLREKRCLPNEYLYYFYYRERAVDNILHAAQTRGELIEELNRKMTAELSEIDVDADFNLACKCFEHWYGMRADNYMANETGVQRAESWHFDPFGPDDGGYAGVALRYIELKETAQDGKMILCVPNGGAIPGLLETDVVEVTCDVEDGICKPHAFEADEVLPGNLELIRRVKYYERMAARGIVNRCKSDIVECLEMHPLVNSRSIAEELADQYIELNRDYIEGWK